MRYYDYFKGLDKNICLSILGDVLDKLNGTASCFSWIVLEDDYEKQIKSWLLDVGFATEDRHGLYKTNKFDKFYNDFTDKLCEYVYIDNDKCFDMEAEVPNDLMLNYIDGVLVESLDISIKYLLEKSLNPLKLLGELYDLEGTDEFHSVIDVEYNCCKWLQDIGLLDTTVKGSFYCKKEELRQYMCDTLSDLLATESYHLCQLDIDCNVNKSIAGNSKNLVIAKTKKDILEYFDCERYTSQIEYSWKMSKNISYEDILVLLRLDIAVII